MSNYFRMSERYPYHLSIGGLLFNSEHKILVHHFTDVSLSEAPHVKEVYLLMRETIKPNETIEDALARGLMEEFGATGEVVEFVGSVIDTKHNALSFPAEKTTLYFLVRYITHDESLREVGSFESTSTLEWHDADFLIAQMKSQRQVNASFDESVIVERFVQDITFLE